jgi:hypothetical protein
MLMACKWLPLRLAHIDDLGCTGAPAPRPVARCVTKSKASVD